MVRTVFGLFNSPILKQIRVSNDLVSSLNIAGYFAFRKKKDDIKRHELHNLLCYFIVISISLHLVLLYYF